MLTKTDSKLLKIRSAMATITLNISSSKYKLVRSELQNSYIQLIDQLPTSAGKIAKLASDEVLDTQIRAGAWTVRQILHHLADSHINSYIRIKLALTEENVTFKPYTRKYGQN